MQKFIFIIVFLALFPFSVFAQDFNNPEPSVPNSICEARVIKILDEKEIIRDNGIKNLQQNILLKILNGEDRDLEVAHIGITDAVILSTDTYKVGERVIVEQGADLDGNTTYYIVDRVRRNQLYLLALIFAAVIVFIGKMKGLKALLSLAVSFFLIIGIILPLILKGFDPLTVAAIGSLAIVAVVIYITEGWRKKSHLAILSAVFSLAATVVVSILFSNLANLTGLMQEEVAFLITIGENVINFKGLLLAGIIIGTVGVLDDVVVSQVEAVEQIKKANPTLPPKTVFKMAYQVGTSHLGSMINTLFLTYAGASLPLLLLFVVRVEPFSSFGTTINHEIIASEIIRSFAGSIGVALSLPISTYLAAFWLEHKKRENHNAPTHY